MSAAARSEIVHDAGRRAEVGEIGLALERIVAGDGDQAQAVDAGVERASQRQADGAQAGDRDGFGDRDVAVQRFGPSGLLENNRTNPRRRASPMSLF